MVSKLVEVVVGSSEVSAEAPIWSREDGAIVVVNTVSVTRDAVTVT